MTLAHYVNANMFNAELVNQGKVSKAVAKAHSIRPEEFDRLVKT